MSEEDDWFERALRDIDEESDSSGSTGDDEGGDDAEGTGDGSSVNDGDDDRPETADYDLERADEEDSEPVDGGSEAPADPSGDDPFGGGSFDGDDPSGSGSFGDDDPFSGDSASGDDPFGGGSFGDDDPFGGDPSGDDFSDDDSPDDDSPDDDSPDDDSPDDDSPGDDSPDDDSPDDDSPDDDSPDGDSPDDDSSDDTPLDDASLDDNGGRPDPAGRAGPDREGSADPFGGYRNTPSSPSQTEDFGFDGFDGGDPGGESPGFDVDPEEFESDIDRIDIGIEGLDEMILGGVPRQSLLSVIGGPGTGKTTFALQFLNEALESGRNGVYITLEQTRESIFSTAAEKGWSFREYADDDRLAIVAIDPIEMANSLASIRNDLTRLIAEFDADRLVLDSVSLLEMMYDHPAKRRSEVFGFTRSLKDAGVTTLLTSEASEENPYASRHGLVEYLTDAVFVLQYIRGSDFRETRLAVEIQKIRDANHSRETKPYEITDSGISVYGQANIF